jgi:hypothetical protein
VTILVETNWITASFAGEAGLSEVLHAW